MERRKLLVAALGSVGIHVSEAQAIAILEAIAIIDDKGDQFNLKDAVYIEEVVNDFFEQQKPKVK